LLAAQVIDYFTAWAYKDLLLAAALGVGDRFAIVSEKLKPGPSEESLFDARAHA
jgi:hypothetical protein